MANKGIGSTTVSMLPDEVKTTLSGACTYTPLTGEKWVYKQATISTSSADIFETTDEFFGNTTASDGIATGDKIKWIAIKHTGTTNGTSSTSESVLLSQATGAVAYNGTTTASTILIEPNDLFVAKFNGTTVADLHARTATMAGQSPNGDGTGSVLVYVAVIVEDVA